MMRLKYINFLIAALMALFTLILASCGLTKSKCDCKSGPGVVSVSVKGDSLPGKTLSLTFSGGPSQVTSAIGDYLKANNIQATFFVRGMSVDGFEGTLQRLRSQGHLVANGGFSGRPLTEARDVVLELRRTDELITPFVTGDLFLFRAPLGLMNQSIADEINHAGLSKYVGSIGSDIGEDEGSFLVDDHCWQSSWSYERCTQGYLAKIRNVDHGIVLLHDTSDHTLALTKDMVTSLKNESFVFVRLDQTPTIRSRLEQSGGRPGEVAGEDACNDY